jgi:aldose 1-epimerase
MRYSASWESAAGVEIAVLRDEETGAVVRVAPALGNTCVGWRIGDWRVLDEPPDEEQLRARASSYGIPILFPWPNRLRGGRFKFEGREYRVPPNPGAAHVNHGLVRDRPWQVKLARASDESAVIWSEIRSQDFPELAEVYPSAFALQVSYWLRQGRLEIEARVENVGKAALPFGFGLHPYFTLPLGPGSRRQSCELRVPAEEVWELKDHLPTGQRRPVAGRDDLRRFRALGQEVYDDLFHLGAERFRASVRDPNVGRQIDLDAPGTFGECVVFAPSHRDVVALEPYTCITDALNLTGVPTGLQVLAPGDSGWRATVTMTPRQV